MFYKKISLLIVLSLFIGGLSIGKTFVFYASHCAEISVDKNPFYYDLSLILKNGLIKKGYSFTCPDFMPKTSVYFVYTNSNEPISLSKTDTNLNIAIVGDCQFSLDYEFLKQFDIVLPVNLYHTGLLAGMNLVAAHLILPQTTEDLYCNLKFSFSQEKLNSTVSLLDKIIQEAYYEKVL